MRKLMQDFGAVLAACMLAGCGAGGARGTAPLPVPVVSPAVAPTDAPSSVAKLQAAPTPTPTPSPAPVVPSRPAPTSLPSGDYELKFDPPWVTEGDLFSPGRHEHTPMMAVETAASGEFRATGVYYPTDVSYAFVIEGEVAGNGLTATYQSEPAPRPMKGEIGPDGVITGTTTLPGGTKPARFTLTPRPDVTARRDLSLALMSGDWVVRQGQETYHHCNPPERLYTVRLLSPTSFALDITEVDNGKATGEVRTLEGTRQGPERLEFQDAKGREHYTFLLVRVPGRAPYDLLVGSLETQSDGQELTLVHYGRTEACQAP